MKKIFEKISVLICVMAFSIMGIVGQAKAETSSVVPYEEYDVYILGEQVTSENMSGEGWRFEPSTDDDEFNKLYLDNANLVLDEDKIEGSAVCAIMASKDLEIVLTGDNTISINIEDLRQVQEFYAILIRSKMHISGEGSLTIEGKDCKVSEIQHTMIYTDKMEIDEGIELNIKGMKVSKAEDVTDTVFVGYGISARRMTIHKDAVINITDYEVDLSTDGDIGGLIALVGSEMVVNDDVKINIEIKDIVAWGIVCTAFTGNDITIRENVDISIKMGKLLGTLVSGGGGNYGLESSTRIQIGDNCKIKVEADDVSESAMYVGLNIHNVIMGDNSIIEAYAGDGCLFGSLIETVEIGKDSAIRCNGDVSGLLYVGDGEWTCPMYGGTNIGDTNELTIGEVVYDASTFPGAVYGDSAAQYIEIGPLLTINLQCENGTIDKTSFTIHNGHEVGMLPIPVATREGYEFAGWYTAESGGEKVESTTKLSKSMTLYAQWKLKTYTVQFDANGGKIDTPNKTVEHGKPIGTLPTPRKEEYTFVGWYTAKTGGNEIDITTAFTEGKTIYARWEVAKPNMMTGFTYSECTSNTVTLKWTENSSATGYEVYQYKNGEWSIIDTLKDNTKTSYKVTGLSASTAYQFKIVPYKTVDGVTVYGGEATRTVNTLPSYTKGFTYSARTATTVTLKWNKNKSADGYVIQQYKGGKWKTIKTVKGNAVVKYKVTGLKSGTTYKFRIKAYKNDGSKKLYAQKYSTKSVRTLPSTVKNFTYKARTAKTITLKWAKNTSADGYVIQQYKGGKWKTIKTITKKSTVSYKVTGLKSGKTYKFRIKAYKKDGSKKLYSLSYTTKSIKTL